jgi:Uma2 family endonuclease
MSAVMSDWITRHRITVEEYYRMAEAGILARDARVELIEGVIVDMPGMGSEHAWALAHLNRVLIEAIGKHAHLLPQLPIRLSDMSEPVPDLALVRPEETFYKKGHPGAGDTFLIIEVSDSSLRYDVEIKAPLYARHRVPEYWIVDLQGHQIRFFRSPGLAQYADVTTATTPGIVSPIALPDVKIDLTGILDE